MKKNKHNMDKELKVAGHLIKLINPTWTKQRLKLANKLTKRIKSKVDKDYIHFSEVRIPREDDSLLRVCIYKPVKPKENACGVLWLHGGGYAMGSPKMEEAMIQRLIKTSDCVVIAPDYRLSFEAPYPAALEDSYLTLLWMKNNAEELLVNDSQLMVGGVSAGGGLCAALTLYARDKKEVAIAFQMPLYPMLDDRMTSESATNNNAPLWNSKSNRNAWELYLGDLFESDQVPAYAAPSRTKDYSALPPAATFVGELEPFKDETIEYVEHLRQAGISVEFKIYKGCFHGFDVVNPKAQVSKAALSFIIGCFRHACAHYYAPQHQ